LAHYVMEIDETELTEFIEVLPVAEDPSEKEFFGSCAFEITDGDLKCRISFGTNHGDVGIALRSSSFPEPILEVVLEEVTKVRLQADPSILIVLGRARGASGTDPQPTERLTLELDPLRIRIND